MQSINEAAEAWGVTCMRYEIRDISPPSGVRAAMELQVPSHLLTDSPCKSTHQPSNSTPALVNNVITDGGYAAVTAPSRLRQSAASARRSWRARASASLLSTLLRYLGTSTPGGCHPQLPSTGYSIDHLCDSDVSVGRVISNGPFSTQRLPRWTQSTAQRERPLRSSPRQPPRLMASTSSEMRCSRKAGMMQRRCGLQSNISRCAAFHTQVL